ncbi:MAG: hotdog domain-containing protein [Acidobacteriota bacterium]
MIPATHLAIDATLCGRPRRLSEGRAEVVLDTLPSMVADDAGLVHGGFVFGCVDYAAMLAVNHPNVVLGAADCRFLAPVRLADRLVAEAQVEEAAGRKRRVRVTARVGEREVLTGVLTCFVLQDHVLAGC